jgi:glycosyltransferase involved in cell wall biosynthesis
MKIGFDISQTGESKAGCGFFADSLILALTNIDKANEYILYPRFGTSFWDPDAKKTTRKINLSNVSRKLIGSDFGESMVFWKNLPSDAEERLGNPDIIHANNFSCPRGLQHSRMVYTLYDLHFLQYPEWTTEENRCVCFEGVFAAATYGDYIIAISRYSRDRFLEFFPHYPSERIRVVHLGSRFSAGNTLKVKSRISRMIKPGEFWLAVGTLEPRKNLRGLLSAFALYKKGQMAIQYPLVLAGGKGWLEDGLEEFIQELGLSDNVHRLGYVSDEDLAWLYSNCFSFVYPSLYEGFGLPVLEALELGAAVITSNTTSLPEVAGDAAYYIDPLDEEDIVRAFNKLASDADYHKKLKRRAVVQSEKFSWEKSAAAVLDIYREVKNLPKLGGYPA